MRSLQLSVVVAGTLFALPLLIVTGRHDYGSASTHGKSPVVVSPAAPAASLRTLPVLADQPR